MVCLPHILTCTNRAKPVYNLCITLWITKSIKSTSTFDPCQGSTQGASRVLGLPMQSESLWPDRLEAWNRPRPIVEPGVRARSKVYAKHKPSNIHANYSFMQLTCQCLCRTAIKSISRIIIHSRMTILYIHDDRRRTSRARPADRDSPAWT